MTSRIVSRAIAVLIVATFAIPLFAADTAAPLFKTKCTPCHGEKGTGDTTMGKKLGVRNLASTDVQKQADSVLIGIITKGKGKMPAYAGKITDAEIKALVAHIRTLAVK